MHKGYPFSSNSWYSWLCTAQQGFFMCPVIISRTGLAKNLPSILLSLVNTELQIKQENRKALGFLLWISCRCPRSAKLTWLLWFLDLFYYLVGLLAKLKWVEHSTAQKLSQLVSSIYCYNNCAVVCLVRSVSATPLSAMQYWSSLPHFPPLTHSPGNNTVQVLMSY